MSILVLAIWIDRWKAVKKSKYSNENILDLIEPYIQTQNWAEGIEVCERNEGFFSTIIQAGLRSKIDKIGSPQLAMERSAKKQLLVLENRLSWLATCGNIAPYIGLFGTVIGIIDAFKNISLMNSSGVGIVSAGIAEALISTASGIFVAVISVIIYNSFQNKLERLAQKTEVIISEMDEQLS
jgi:biopolymer transport protein ExbB/TolQ